MIPVVNPLRNPVRRARQAKDVPQYFTRNSIAYTSDGSVQVAANTPRFEAGKFGKAILIEEGTTNLATNVKDFTAWSKFRVTVTADAAVAPDGTLTADKIICTGNIDPYVYQKYNLGQALGGKTFTWSVWVWTDVGQPTEMTLFIYDNSTVTYVKAQTFVLTTTPQRYTLTYTFPTDCSATSLTYRIDLKHTPAAGDYAYAWGAQLEQKLYPTSFIDGSRASEILIMPIADVLNSNSFTIEMWIKQSIITTSAFAHGKRLLDLGDGLWLWNLSPAWPDPGRGDASNARRIIADFGKDASGVRQFKDLDSSTRFSTTNFEYFAVTFDGATFRFYRNGSLWSSRTPSKINAFTKIAFGDAGWIIDDLRISNIARSDAEIAEAYSSGQPLPVDEWITAIL